MRPRPSLGLLLCSMLLLFASRAGAETDWFASLYTNEGVELRADERVFALYALLNGMGYDEAPIIRTAPVPAREMHVVRLKVRSAVRMTAADEEKLNAFFNAHPKPAEAYGRYALALKGPAGFERTSAAAADLKGFEALLAEGFGKQKLAELFTSVQDEYRSALKGYHGVVDAPVGAVRRLLKMKEDEAPRVVLVVNLLDGQGKSYSALSGDELWVVVGPSKMPDLFAVARELARARIEPLAAARAPDLESAALITETLTRAVASAALAMPDAEIDAQGQRDGFPQLREWVRQVEAFSKGDKALDSFVSEAVPMLQKEAGKELPATVKKPSKAK
ncbi:MAG: hypothetical protein HY901_10835 [Deltaproteobacteria bacterium]|nr:hypothetical protein [Deltaproteobacteria bacterium]